MTFWQIIRPVLVSPRSKNSYCTILFNMSQPPPRQRIRQLIPKLRLGKWPTGPFNSITDVPGVLTHTQSIHNPPQSEEQSPDINTGVTVILPRPDWYKYSSFTGVFSFNGCGELTSSHWLDETGLLASPIILTTTSAVGDAYRGVWEYTIQYHSNQDKELDLFLFPTVGETFDGYLNDQSRFAVTPQHIVQGIRNATADPVPEGNTGGGTGMICHRFKGGTGSSSRVVNGFDVDGNEMSYTVGVLVQANYGTLDNLCIGGVPVGQILKEQGQQAAEQLKQGEKEPRKDGSIIVVVGTDAPLLPIQLQRLAKRATIGLAKVGGYGNNTSGDIFLAFSNANKIPFQVLSTTGSRPTHPYVPQLFNVRMSDNDTIDGLFEAAADATEEAIYNALCMAETMIGFRERKIAALDLAGVKEIVEKRL
ncbi:peptidase family S58 domain-containing protein [Trichoderma ceciliae]